MFKHLFLPNRFFGLLGGLGLLFAASFFVRWAFPVAQTALVLAAVAVVIDAILLFGKNINLNGTRNAHKIWSLADENEVTLYVKNKSPFALHITVIDELPFQLQRRDFEMQLTLQTDEDKNLSYPVVPLSRGEYVFGNANMYVRTTILGLLERRVILAAPETVAVYPSLMQMKKFELKAFARISTLDGIKKQRRIGHSYEFEQIKNYVRGDDYRSINWKATGRRNDLMVNQYEDERSQQVYCIIDKSRAMRMPFAGLSLMDYAINTCLVVANIVLKKYDRIGLITFSDKLGTAIKADRKANQLNLLLNALYTEKERVLEANFELAYQATRNIISGRSLILFYTNFESMYALERALPLLRRINQQHLLVVVFFKNTEIEAFTQRDATTVAEIYEQTIAQKLLVEKQQMVQKLRQYGIQAVLTAPEDLSLNTVNKYLELKSRGLI
jgi:uncharacterized protein (DUF58 family)